MSATVNGVPPSDLQKQQLREAFELVGYKTNGDGGIEEYSGGIKLRRLKQPTTVLLGDSWQAQFSGVVGIPNSVVYDNTTGVMTLGFPGSHGVYPGGAVFVAAKGYPAWAFYDLPTTWISSTSFSVQLEPGLGVAPTTAWTVADPATARGEHPLSWVQPTRYKVARNMGIAGETSAEIRARCPAAVALLPGVIDLRAGINDETITAIESVYADNLWMCRQAANAGIPVILHTIPPHGAPSALRAVWIVELNKLLRTIPAQVPGVILCDDYAALVDSSSALGAAKAGHMHTDNLHLSILGAKALSVPTQAAYDAIGKLTSQLPTSAIDAYDAINNPTSTNALQNGLLLTATGGSVAGVATGAVASGMTVGATSMTSATASVVAAANGIGNAQRVVGAPSAAGANMYARFAGFQGRLTPGKRYIGGCHIKTSGIPANASVKAIYVQTIWTVAGVTYYKPQALQLASTGTGAAQFPQVDIDMDVLMEPVLIPEGATNLIFNAIIEFAGSNANAVTLDVSQPVFRLID